jgi:protein SCO1/2
MNLKKKIGFVVFALFPLAGAYFALADNPQTNASREAIRAQHFPDVVLTTHEGKQVRFYEDLIKDKIVTINFMYTQCAEGVCPITTHNLVQAQQIIKDRVGPNRVGRDIFMYSITIDPQHDTPERLKHYAEEHGVQPGWLFLTGKPDDIEQLRRKLGFVDLDPELDKDKTSHIGNVRYGNEALQQWSVVPGMAKPDVIATSILYADWPKKSTQVK